MIDSASPAENVCELELLHVVLLLPEIVQAIPVLTGGLAPAGSLRTVNVYESPSPGSSVSAIRRLLTLPPVGSTS